MFKYSLILFLLLLNIGVAYTQTKDSLFVVKKGKELAILYYAQEGESLQMLARRFYTPVEKIENMSMLRGMKKLPIGTEVYIPLLEATYSKARYKQGIDYQQELYFKVGEYDDLQTIALYTGIKKPDIVLWNNLKGNTLEQGLAVFIGWMKMVKKDSINLTNGLAYPKLKEVKTVATSTGNSSLDSLYDVQTSNGSNTISEKGKVVFFEKPGKNDKFYAFHNTSTKGTAIKVFNPGTGKTIVVQVLGTMPETKAFDGCVIGISNIAKEALGVVEDKAWCELTYAPN